MIRDTCFSKLKRVFEMSYPKEHRELETVREDISKVIRYPRYCNSQGVGLVKGNRVGIRLGHETESDRQECLNLLFQTGLLIPGPDGLYWYRDVLVEFRVSGRIVPL